MTAMTEYMNHGDPFMPSTADHLKLESDYIEPDPNPGDEPSFTFITHNDDLQTKRIRDATARKQIRSHVMRDVRRRERIAGLRRPSKKERMAKGARIGNGQIDSRDDAFEDETIGMEEAVSKPITKPRSRRSVDSESSSTHVPCQPAVAKDESQKDQSGPLVRQKRRTSSVVSTAVEEVPMSQTPSINFIDPFDTLYTLPGARGPSRIVDLLIKHCVHIFLPMTFPLEQKSLAMKNIRIQKLMEHQITDAAVFYGAMAISAAHRATLRPRNYDLIHLTGDSAQIPGEPDYYLMHDLALRETNRRMRDPEKALELNTFGAVMALMAASLTIGSFAETRMHLDGMIRMLELRSNLFDNLDGPANLMLWNILDMDLKAAIGLACRPRIRAPQRFDGMDEALCEKVLPPRSLEIHKFARRFHSIDVLSTPLLSILEGSRDLAYMDDFNFYDAEGLTAKEHLFLRRRLYTLEHDLLHYPYEQFPCPPDEPDKVQMPFVEAAVRLAVMRYFNTITIFCVPNSGMGRALTLHTRRVFEEFQESYSDLPPEVLDVLIWVTFIAIEGSVAQVEESFFYHHLRSLLSLRKYADWWELENTMKGFLYIPRLWQSSWKKIWDKAHEQTVTF